MINKRILAIGAAAAVSVAAILTISSLRVKSDPPMEARRGDDSDAFFGAEIPDPYRWMEAMDSPEVKNWAAAQQKLTENYHDQPVYRKFYDRHTALADFSALLRPVQRGNRIFMIQANSGTAVGSVVMKAGMDGAIRTLIDADHDLPPLLNGKSPVISAIWPDPEGEKLAFAYSAPSSRWFTVAVFDVATGDILPDRIDGLYAGLSSLAWDQDGGGLYYTAFDAVKDGSEVNTRPENRQFFYHVVGDKNEDRRITGLDNLDSGWFLGFGRTRDDDRLVITAFNGTQPYNRIYLKDMNPAKNEIRGLFTGDDANYSYIGNFGEDYFFYTNRDAPRGRIVSAAPGNTEILTDIVSEAEDVISAGSQVGGNAIGLYGGHIVLMYLKDGAPYLKIFDRAGAEKQVIDLPVGGSVWGGFSGDQKDETVFYGFLGLVHPSTLYSLNVRTGQAALFSQPEIGVNSGDYMVRKASYTNRDGQKVPIFIAHKKGIERDGNNPALMYGYGAFGWVSFLWYQPHVIQWLENGGVYAQPGIRGGGEFGEDWHQAGIRDNRINAINDYVDAAKWLFEEGYTRPSLMAANGGSASAALAATAAMKNPDVFKAAVIDIPILDMVRYPKFSHAASWLYEFGDPGESRSMFEAIAASSPYHLAGERACYPAMLFMVGEQDQTAVPMHGYKTTAALRHAQTCDNPVLLKLMPDTGHNFGSTPEQRADSRATQLTFLVRALGLDW